MADTTIAVTVYLDSDTKHEIDRRKRLGFTLNGFIRAAIREHLKKHPAPYDPDDLEAVARAVSHV